MCRYKTCLINSIQDFTTEGTLPDYLYFLEETPEFGQFFRDVSSMLKEKTGETGT